MNKFSKSYVIEFVKMKVNFKSFIVIFITIFFSFNASFAEKYQEVKKLYDLYSQKILDFDQLTAGLEKMNLNNLNMKNLISLRDNEIISEDDFVEGIKIIISDNYLGDDKEQESENNIIDSNKKKYEFQTEITIIHSYIISDFKYGEIWNHMFILEDEKITEITFKDSKNIDLIKLTRPKFRDLKNNKFSIRSSVTYIPEPSVGIRYDFKGKFEKSGIVGEVIITYTGHEAPGTILLKAKTN